MRLIVERISKNQPMDASWMLCSLLICSCFTPINFTDLTRKGLELSRLVLMLIFIAVIFILSGKVSQRRYSESVADCRLHVDRRCVEPSSSLTAYTSKVNMRRKSSFEFTAMNSCCGRI